MISVSVPADYPTIQAALDHASGLSLKRKNECVIKLPEGEFVFNQANLTVTHNGLVESLSGSAAIICDMLNGKGIKIDGAPAIYFAGVSVYRLATISPGIHQLSLTVDDVSGAVAGRYVKIRYTEGTGDHASIRGCHKLISVREELSQIVLELRNHRDSMPQNIGLTSFAVMQLNTTLRWEGLSWSGGDFGGFDICTPFGEIDNVAIIGDGDTDANSGIVCRLGTVLNLGQGVGIAGWGRNGLFLIEGAQVEGVDLQVSDCVSNGINVTGTSYFSGTRAGASGCTYGVVVGVGAGASLSSGHASNNIKGFYVASGGGLVIGGSYMMNNEVGSEVKENGVIDDSAGSFFSGNDVDKIESSGGLYVA